ncbi:sigma factor-like helix-turn-helix DNA-binding protein, partial [Streptomyces sp. NPDC001941]|uniref:sigma factor-like helix-turn-helix DNA-binding protein n=1 Tax=Streptomyces sp. NPDC001941 TaxID=3154659 RepID=UPI00331F026E
MAEDIRVPLTAEGLGELFAGHRASLTRTARRALLAHRVPESAVCAEDLVQHAFEQALGRAATIEHPLAYLHAVVRKEAAHRAGRGAAHARLEALRAADPLRFDPLTAGDCAALVANRQVVWQAVSELTAAQAAAVYATKALDCTQAEAAALLAKAPGTVATHVSRGVALLRASLGAVLAAVLVCGTGLLLGGRLREAVPAREPGGRGEAAPSVWAPLAPWPWALPLVLLGAVLAVRLLPRVARRRAAAR